MTHSTIRTWLRSRTGITTLPRFTPASLRTGNSLAPAAVLMAIVALAALAPLPLSAQEFGFGTAPSGSEAVIPGSAPAQPGSPGNPDAKASPVPAPENAAPGVKIGGMDLSILPAAPGVSISGRLGFSGTAWLDPAGSGTGSTALSSAAIGRLTFTAKTSAVESSIALKLDSESLLANPADIIDTASIRLYKGPLEIEAGLLKLTWGKADSMGPLDVLNPQDLSDPSRGAEGLDAKLARPMIRTAWALGNFTKLEAVGGFGFKGHRLPMTGRWTPSAIAAQKVLMRSAFYYGTDPGSNSGRGNGYYASYYGTAWSSAYAAAYSQAFAMAWQSTYSSAYTTYIMSHPGDTAGATAAATTAATAAEPSINAQAVLQAITAATTITEANKAAIENQAGQAADAALLDFLVYPETDTLAYSQAGLRLTTSLGAVDLGFQYFYGYLPLPAISRDPARIAAAGNHLTAIYNRYHQIGADTAFVLGGINLRMEAAANITEDLQGDNPSIYNPALAWSVGADRELFAGINLTVIGTGSWRYASDKVGTRPFDIEADTDTSSTRILAQASQKLARDTIEWKIATVIGIENRDYLLRPSVTFTLGEGKIEFSGGLFGGSAAGDLGQYAKNSWLRAGFSHQF